MTEHSPVLEAPTAEQINEPDYTGPGDEQVCDGFADFDQTGRAPFATRVRAVLLLSVASWLVIAMGIVLVLN